MAGGTRLHARGRISFSRSRPARPNTEVGDLDDSPYASQYAAFHSQGANNAGTFEVTLQLGDVLYRYTSQEGRTLYIGVRGGGGKSAQRALRPSRRAFDAPCPGHILRRSLDLASGNSCSCASWFLAGLSRREALTWNSQILRLTTSAVDDPVDPTE